MEEVWEYKGLGLTILNKQAKESFIEKVKFEQTLKEIERVSHKEIQAKDTTSSISLTRVYQSYRGVRIIEVEGTRWYRTHRHHEEISFYSEWRGKSLENFE